MYDTLPLFGEHEDLFKTNLSANLRSLAAQNIFLGASSWKYEGWLGSIYSRERYLSRGRFSAKLFQQECLKEYAEIFPIVSGDFTFYNFPTRLFWQSLFSQVDAPFRFAFKLPEDITLPVFPKHPRYGLRAGQRNAMFLDPEIFEREFLMLLRPYEDRVALLILEFAASVANAFPNISDFGDALSRFFSVLPASFRYAVEIRSEQHLGPEYFRALHEHRVAHLFNSWTHMPSLQEQMSIQDAYTANFTASRALLRPGRHYEESLRLFAPYAEVREPNAEIRKALRDLLIRGKKRAEPVFLFVNNRLEGFAPGTIAAVVEGL